MPKEGGIRMTEEDRTLPENFPEEEKRIKADAEEVIRDSREQISRAQNILAAEVKRLGQLLERN